MDERYGIIYIHGIVGNNRIFDFLKPLVPTCFESMTLTLKGHGGDALDFSRSSMSEWKVQVESALADMKSRCEHILAVGHSMGCLLLMDQCAKGNVSGLFLLNPPIRISPRLALFSNAIKVAIGRTDNPVTQAAKKAYGVSLDFNPFHYYGWPLRYLELFKEIRRVRNKVLPDISCHVQALLSANDEMVALTSVNELGKMVNITITTLPDSTHYYYSPADRLVILNQFKDFLSSDSKKD